jgi:K+-transporting ATPase KdpF subunit
VTISEAIGLVASILLIGYLLVALVFPERF